MIILKTSKKLSLNLMKKLVKINHSLQKLHCLHHNPSRLLNHALQFHQVQVGRLYFKKSIEICYVWGLEQEGKRRTTVAFEEILQRKYYESSKRLAEGTFWEWLCDKQQSQKWFYFITIWAFLGPIDWINLFFTPQFG